MSESEPSSSSTGASSRRRFFAGVIAAVQAAIGGTLGVVVGGAVLSPGLARRESSWLPAGRLTDLPINQPTPVMLRLERQDGYQRVIDRHAVFLDAIDDHPCPERRRFDQRSIDLGRGGVQCHPDKQAGELRIDQHGAVAVVPVKSDKP